MKFGTDGFRGPTDTKITPDFCLNLGFHTGCIIKDKGYDSVIIGKDTRVSGYMLESALQAGFISAGIDVKLAGPIPTPAVSLRNLDPIARRIFLFSISTLFISFKLSI